MVKRRPQVINLIPPELRPPPLLTWDLGLVALLIATVVSGSILSYGYNLQAARLEKQAAVFQQESSKLDQKIIDLRNQITSNSTARQQHELVDKLVHNQVPWAEVFKELGLIMPQNTWLTGLSAINNSGQISMFMHGQADSQASMANLYSALEKSVHFARLLVLSSEISEATHPPLYNFQFASRDLASKKKKGGAK